MTTGQVVSALKAMGFYTVLEAALGADMVAYFEAQELMEKGFLTSSCCLTFEELQVMIDAYDIDLKAMEDDVLNNASYFGRIFARSGGLTDAVAETFKEMGVTPDQFEPRPPAAAWRSASWHCSRRRRASCRRTSSKAWPVSRAASAAPAA